MKVLANTIIDPVSGNAFMIVNIDFVTSDIGFIFEPVFSVHSDLLIEDLIFDLFQVTGNLMDGIVEDIDILILEFSIGQLDDFLVAFQRHAHQRQ